VFQLTAMSERRTIGAARPGDLEIGMELSNRGQHLARPDPHRAPGQLRTSADWDDGARSGSASSAARSSRLPTSHAMGGPITK
jgi:hypothetical protein